MLPDNNLMDRHDRSWERGVDKDRQTKAIDAALEGMKNYLIVNTLGAEASDEDMQPMIDRMYDKLRDSTTRQDLLEIIFTLLVDDASSEAEEYLEEYRKQIEVAPTA